MSGQREGKVPFATATGGAIAGAISRHFAAECASLCCVGINTDAVGTAALRIKWPG